MARTAPADRIPVTTEMANDPLLEPLLHEHRDEILRYLLRRLDRAEVPDAFADVVVVARRHIRAAPAGDGVLWLYSIAGRVVDVRRPRGVPICARCDERRSQARSAERPTLLSIVDRLDEQDREVLRLYAWEELSETQIAVVTGLSERVVRVILDEISDRLRDAVEQTDDVIADDSMWMATEVTS